MPQTRTEALTAVIDDLANIEIGLNEYYDDAEPQAVIDNVLTGKINSLRAFCQVLGWSELVTSMQDMETFRVRQNISGQACKVVNLAESFLTVPLWGRTKLINLNHKGEMT